MRDNLLSIRNIHQLAGLLEGEGCFGYYRCLTICIQMTDKDVMEWAARLMNPRSIGTFQRPNSTNKLMFRFWVSGTHAAEWMMTLYPLMGSRRQKQIREALDVWRTRPLRASERVTCPKGHLLDLVYVHKEEKRIGRISRRCSQCRQEKNIKFRKEHPSYFRIKGIIRTANRRVAKRIALYRENVSCLP